MKLPRLTNGIRACFAIIAIALAPAPASLAQSTPAAEHPEASWKNLQRLKPGQEIQVVQKDLKSWSGRFSSASDDSVSLKTPAGDRIVPRSDVLRVSRYGGKRLRNALIGAAAAGAAGLAAGIASGGCSKGGFGGFCVGKGELGAALGGAGAIIGGGIGAAIPGHTVIYRATPK